MKTLLTLALCCATIAPAAHAQSADDSGFHSHYPQHYFFQYMSPPAPSAEGPFGFDSGANRGYEDKTMSARTASKAQVPSANSRPAHALPNILETARIARRYGRRGHRTNNRRKIDDVHSCIFRRNASVTVCGQYHVRRARVARFRSDMWPRRCRHGALRFLARRLYHAPDSGGHVCGYSGG